MDFELERRKGVGLAVDGEEAFGVLGFHAVRICLEVVLLECVVGQSPSVNREESMWELTDSSQNGAPFSAPSIALSIVPRLICA